MPKRNRSWSPTAARAAKHQQIESLLPSKQRSLPSENAIDTEMLDAPSQIETAKPPFPITGRKLGPVTQEKLKLAVTSTPRYLFRTWRDGDDDGVSSSDASIAPGAFQVYAAPQSMFDLPKKLLAKDALAKLRGHRKPSLFSDWTHSLRSAIEKAEELEARAAPAAAVQTVHLCILDTSKVPDSVIILHTSHLGLIDAYIPKVRAADHKFLAYGVIPGSAYRAASFDEQVAAGEQTWACSSAEDFIKNFDAEVDLAAGFAKAFGPEFELPFVANLLAMYTHHYDVLVDAKWRNFLAVVLGRRYAVPIEWRDDPAIMTDIACMVEYKDFMRGRALMRALVRRKFGASISAARRPVQTTVTQIAALLKSETIKDDDEEDDGYVPDDVSDPEDEMSDGGDGDTEEIPNPLPAGRMDESTKRQLQEAMRHTPRYLFRAWNNVDWPSGGYVGLNTTDAITPLAYDHRRKCGNASIFEHDHGSLTTMIRRHLWTDTTIATEFSSWGASLQVAFHFTGQYPNAYISIIDTRKLTQDNIVLHVPSLEFLTGNHGGYDHEYLAHGVIAGQALSVAPLKAFTDIGVPTHFNIRGLQNPSACSAIDCQPITADEIRQARRVAEQYDPSFIVAVTLAILTLKQRCGDFWNCEHIKNLELIVDELQDCEIPAHWCKDRSIVTDMVYTQGYGEL